MFDPAGGRALRVADVMRPRPARFDRHFSVDVDDDPTHLDRLMRAVEHDPLPWLDDHRARWRPARRLRR